MIAPPSANTVLLSERGFRETPEGEWIYTLTAADSAGKKCVNAARIFAAAGLNAFERTERRMHDVSVFRSQ